MSVVLIKVIKYLVTNTKKYYDRENFSLYVPNPDKPKPKIFATKFTKFNFKELNLKT